MAEALINVEPEDSRPAQVVPRPRKKLVRRRARDWSQPLRWGVQGIFAALNIYLGFLFYFFVRQFEPGGVVSGIGRPAGVEGWLPIAGLMNLKYFLVTGSVPAIHPAAMFLLAAFLAMAVIFRKAFCSWLCPVGTLSEALWRLGRRLLGRSWKMPRWLDLPLRGLKYLLLAFFLWAIGGMSAAAIEGFLSSPYGLVADVKMLHFFTRMGVTTAITLASLAALSLFFQNFWCRYLCPYGALLGLASLLSPARIRRSEERCIDCAKCAKACPSLLPVDRLVSVRSAECTGCLECVAVCPAAGALDLELPGRRRIPAWALAAGLAAIFLGLVGFAKLTGRWESPIPRDVYQRLVPQSDRFAHP